MYDDPEFEEIPRDEPHKLRKLCSNKELFDIEFASNNWHDDAIVLLFRDGTEVMITADMSQGAGFLTTYKRKDS